MVTTTTPPTPSRTRRRWALTLIAAAQFLVIMDTSIIGVALPQMQADLGFSQQGLSWVFNAYVIAFGGLLLLGGRLADLFGARRIFALGWTVLLAGSVVAALAGTPAAVVAGRAIQGAGAALIAPSALTLLMMLFGQQPKELAKALAVYGAAAPAGGTAGVFLGGVITEWLSWPWIFWLFVPISAAALATTPGLMPARGPAQDAHHRPGSIDLAGATSVTAGLALAVFGIVRAPEQGWASWTTLGALGGAVILLGGFLAIQARRAVPLVRLGIFTAPNLGAANAAQLLLGAAWIPMWFFLNLYLQQVTRFGPFASGAALLPMTITIMILMVVVAPRVVARVGFRIPTVVGLLVLAGGLVWLSGEVFYAGPASSFAGDVLPATLVTAAGMALAFIPSLSAALAGARPEEGGLAAGLVNTSYQVGSALGLALVTAFAASKGLAQTDDPAALTHGFSMAFLGAAAIAALGGLLAAITLRKPAGTAEEAEGEPSSSR
jgi:EmrB/QacA subfamily drug resistance transporter